MGGPIREVKMMADYHVARCFASSRAESQVSDPNIVKRIEDLSKKRFRGHQDNQELHMSKRKKFSYGQNKTSARMISEGEGDNKMKKVVTNNDPIDLVQDTIIDHAYRRVQLFYYLSVAYYKEYCLIDYGRTDLQHGSSHQLNCSAAHSSILPNVWDDFFDHLFRQLLGKGWTKDIDAKLEALGLSDEGRKKLKEEKLEVDEIHEILNEIDTTHGLLNEDCDFYHNMNATIEMPIIVNQYDCVIEDQMRVRALELLNEVSFGTITPIMATTQFVEKMTYFFAQAEKETKKKVSALETLAELELKVWKLERNLTKNKVTEYTNTLQKMIKIQKNIHTSKQYSLSVKLKSRLLRHIILFNKVCGMDQDEKNKLPDTIKKEQPWFPEPIQPLTEPLKSSLKVIQYQKEGTLVPPEENLSGKILDGKRVSLDESELMQQKLEIIRRH